MRLENPKQVKAWIRNLLDQRRHDVLQAWEAANTQTERERLHVAIHEIEALRDAADGALRDAGDGDNR